MAAAQSHQVAFSLALERFKAKLTEKEKDTFQGTTLDELKMELNKVQQRHCSKRQEVGMKRLEKFLEAMNQYDKVVTVFLNTSAVVAFIWGPMKFILVTASTVVEVFSKLLSAYEQIGENLPLLAQYESLSMSTPNPQMGRVLVTIYEDILEFHLNAMIYFRQKRWKKLFHALWRNFDAQFEALLLKIHRHRTMIESQANVIVFESLFSLRQQDEAATKARVEDTINRQRRVVTEWLRTANSEEHHKQFSDIRREYPNTNRWLLDIDEFQEWFDLQSPSTPTLWLHGIPGAGKTILASFIVDEIRKLPNVKLGFFYCKHGVESRNTFVGVARGIISQILRQNEVILPFLYEHACTSGEDVLSSDDLAAEILREVLHNCETTYIVLDGLDECEREGRRRIASIFQDLCESLPVRDLYRCRCIFISQDDSAARKDFAKIPAFKITPSETSRDIKTYSAAWSRKIRHKFDLSDEREQHISNLITEAAAGMFLFSRIMSEYLFHQKTVTDLDKELEPARFPKGASRLEAAYSRVIESVLQHESGSGHALELLAWLVCAKRPLKWREVQGAFSIDLESVSIDWELRKLRVDSKELCGSLVELRSDGTVDVVHHTLKIYLTQGNYIESSAKELRIALLCMGYLSFPGFDISLPISEISSYAEQGYYAFFEYALAYWASHIEMVLNNSENQNQDAINQLEESADVFLEAHASPKPEKTTRIPRSLSEKLKILTNRPLAERLGEAMFCSRTQLRAFYNKTSTPCLQNLHETLGLVRKSLIELDATSAERREIRTEYYGPKLFKCDRISCYYFLEGFATRKELDEHTNRHERSFFCSFSGCWGLHTGFATLKELTKHEADKHGIFKSDDEDSFLPQERPAPAPVSFNCSFCEKKFTRKHNLDLHLRQHKAPGEKPYVCSTCGRKFSRNGDCTRHEASSHGAGNTFTCGGTLKNGATWGCGKDFSRNDMLLRHYRTDIGLKCREPIEEEEREEQEASSTSKAVTE